MGGVNGDEALVNLIVGFMWSIFVTLLDISEGFIQVDVTSSNSYISPLGLIRNTVRYFDDEPTFTTFTFFTWMTFMEFHHWSHNALTLWNCLCEPGVICEDRSLQDSINPVWKMQGDIWVGRFQCLTFTLGHCSHELSPILSHSHWKFTPLFLPPGTFSTPNDIYNK